MAALPTASLLLPRAALMPSLVWALAAVLLIFVRSNLWLVGIAQYVTRSMYDGMQCVAQVQVNVLQRLGAVQKNMDLHFLSATLGRTMSIVGSEALPIGCDAGIEQWRSPRTRRPKIDSMFARYIHLTDSVYQVQPPRSTCGRKCRQSR